VPGIDFPPNFSFAFFFWRRRLQKPWNNALAYTTYMPQVTLELPDELSAFLTASGHNPQRAVLEAIALEAYRASKLSTAQLRRLLGYRTRTQVHAFLKEHDVYLRYGAADLEHDRHAGDAIQMPSAE
jgi:hypothetical protein